MRLVGLLHLRGVRLRRAPVGDGRGRDRDRRRAGARERRAFHLARGRDALHLRTGGRRQFRRSEHQVDGRAARERFARQFDAHRAGRGVGEKAHRIDRLARRSGRDQHAFAVQIARARQRRFDRGDDRVFARQPAGADLAFGEKTALGRDDRHAARFERAQVRDGRRVFEHRRVHRRRDDERNARRERGVGEQIVGDPVRQLRDDVGRGRNDREHLRLAHQRDVRDRFGALPHRGPHAPPRQGRKSGRADEVLCLLGEDHVEFGAALHQAARERGCFVGRDAAGHAEQHAPSGHDVTLACRSARSAMAGTLSPTLSINRVEPSHTLPIAVTAAGPERAPMSCSGSNVAGSTTSR